LAASTPLTDYIGTKVLAFTVTAFSTKVPKYILIKTNNKNFLIINLIIKMFIKKKREHLQISCRGIAKRPTPNK